MFWDFGWLLDLGFSTLQLACFVGLLVWFALFVTCFAVCLIAFVY